MHLGFGYTDTPANDQGAPHVVVGGLKVVDQLGDGQLLGAGEKVEAAEVERAAGAGGHRREVEVEQPGGVWGCGGVSWFHAF